MIDLKKRVFNFLQKKLIEPRVYAIDILDCKSQDTLLHLCSAFDLDEAYQKALKYYAVKGYDHRFLRLDTYSVATFEELATDYAYSESQDKDEKSRLMRVIIETDDYELYDKHKSSFSLPERSYILERIRVNKKP